jgi:aquaporin rerated protein, other eukaryote
VSGAVPWVRGIVLLPAQLLGGIVAAALVSGLFPGPITVFQTRLAAGTTVTQGQSDRHNCSSFLFDR